MIPTKFAQLFHKLPNNTKPSDIIAISRYAGMANNIYIATRGNDIYTTSNNGSTWTKVVTPITGNIIDISGCGSGLAVLTTTGTWMKDFQIINEKVVVVWTTIALPNDTGFVAIDGQSVSCDGYSDAWLATPNNLYTSHNGGDWTLVTGVPWTQITGSPKQNIVDISGTSNYCYILTDTNLYYYSGGWSLKTVPAKGAIKVDGQYSNQACCTTSTTPYISSNYGASWTQINPPVTESIVGITGGSYSTDHSPMDMGTHYTHVATATKVYIYDGTTWTMVDPISD